MNNNINFKTDLYNKDNKIIEFPDLSPVAKKCFNKLYNKMKQERELARLQNMDNRIISKNIDTKRCNCCGKYFNKKNTILARSKEFLKSRRRYCLSCYQRKQKKGDFIDG